MYMREKMMSIAWCRMSIDLELKQGRGEWKRSIAW